jgi:hypothetical protein
MNKKLFHKYNGHSKLSVLKVILGRDIPFVYPSLEWTR